MKVFLAVLSSVALGNVRWDRDGASSHLVGQAVHFFCRKAFGQPIHSFDEIHSCLPDSQVTKTVYCHTLLLLQPPTPNPHPPSRIHSCLPDSQVTKTIHCHTSSPLPTPN